MNSSIYEGFIRHRRFTPVENSFRYGIFFMYLDLSELPGLFAPYALWSVDKPNIASFMRQDHLGDLGIPLERAVRDVVEARTGKRPKGSVRMLTHLRYFGYCFNPVSFYYCFDENGARVETLVAEVHNTPWLEEHAYVFDDRDNQHPAKDWRRYLFDKKFHVSPFMDMNINYEWNFKMPGPTINAHINNFRKGEKIFDATLTLRRVKIDGGSLSRVLIRYPLMTAKVTAMIYWQALRLRLKGAPFFSHPTKRNERMEGMAA
jgi:DUF1365 family protein